MKRFLYVLIFSIWATFTTVGQTNPNNPFTSKVCYWKNAKIIQTSSGVKREFIQSSANNLNYIQVEAITLDPEQISNNEDNNKFEKLIIVKEGEIKNTISDKSDVVGVGSVILVNADDHLIIENEGDIPAIYYLIQWKTTGNKSSLFVGDQSGVFEWNEIKFKETEKGGVRSFVRRPTPMLNEFEMHVTTLKEGIKSHDPHTHPDDEIILVKSGRVEELIDGKPYQMGAGSFVLLNGNDPHGIRNIGKGLCEYYAFRFLNLD